MNRTMPGQKKTPGEALHDCNREATGGLQRIPTNTTGANSMNTIVSDRYLDATGTFDDLEGSTQEVRPVVEHWLDDHTEGYVELGATTDNPIKVPLYALDDLIRALTDAHAALIVRGCK